MKEALQTSGIWCGICLRPGYTGCCYCWATNIEACLVFCTCIHHVTCPAPQEERRVLEHFDFMDTKELVSVKCFPHSFQYLKVFIQRWALLHLVPSCTISTIYFFFWWFDCVQWDTIKLFKMYVFIYFKTKQTHSVIMNMFMKVVEVFFYFNKLRSAYDIVTLIPVFLVTQALFVSPRMSSHSWVKIAVWALAGKVSNRKIRDLGVRSHQFLQLCLLRDRTLCRDLCFHDLNHMLAPARL